MLSQTSYSLVRLVDVQSNSTQLWKHCEGDARFMLKLVGRAFLCVLHSKHCFFVIDRRPVDQLGAETKAVREKQSRRLVREANSPALPKQHAILLAISTAPSPRKRNHLNYVPNRMVASRSTCRQTWKCSVSAFLKQTGKPTIEMFPEIQTCLSTIWLWKHKLALEKRS